MGNQKVELILCVMYTPLIYVITLFTEIVSKAAVGDEAPAKAGEPPEPDVIITAVERSDSKARTSPSSTHSAQPRQTKDASSSTLVSFYHYNLFTQAYGSDMDSHREAG